MRYDTRAHETEESGGSADSSPIGEIPRGRSRTRTTGESARAPLGAVRARGRVNASFIGGERDPSREWPSLTARYPRADTCERFNGP